VSPARREPIFKIPGVVVGLFAVLALIQIVQNLLSPGADDRMLALFAFVPGRLTFAFDPAGVIAKLQASPDALRGAGLFLLGGGGAKPWTALTYAFVHAGWVHLLSNSVWLAAFGAPVARRIGPWRFLALFCAASIAGALAQWLAQPYALEPVVGASAGISGLMAAATRFVFQPGAPLGAPSAGEDAPRAIARPLSLLETLSEGRALAFILMWFLINFAFGLLAQPLGITSGAIAWQAHIGGFLFGLVLFGVFDRPGGENAAEEAEARIDSSSAAPRDPS